MLRKLIFSCASACALFSCSGSLSAGTVVGPHEYLSAIDVPADFYDVGPTELEDFEDDSLTSNIEVSGAVQIVGPEDRPDVDSVDGDDGAIDGSGSQGRSLFCSCGPTGITVHFPAGTVNAGLVWTDGAGTVTFEAFGPDGSLGVISESDFVDDSYFGTTVDDRFFGVKNPAGVVSLHITNSIGGIEIDHLQYEAHMPEPGGLVLFGGLLLSGLAWRRKRQA